ncbi:uncharacterized protein LOC127658620 [Xyrauchen texanus]|uniref:uncharacterized protein LOC127658620 n=1 Tax=Xyrauchen texanus TaxID=154827 RepID=UPI002241C657|nr:uncharacterized protein LOC127658620 [Xyrauchen texanus]
MIELQFMKGAPLQLGGTDCGIFMLMYALYVTLGKPFDFSASDMPVLRRWWCHQLLQAFPLASQQSVTKQMIQPDLNIMEATPSVPDIMEATPSVPDIMEVTPCTRIHDSAVMKRILLACDRVEENRTHFAGKVHLPQVIRMNEDDALLAITMRDLFIDSIFYEGEMNEDKIQTPFLFTFERKEDMEFFMQEIYDKRNICVSCLHNPHLQQAN